MKKIDSDLQLFCNYLKNERFYSAKTIQAYRTDLLQAKKFWQKSGGFAGWNKVQRQDIELFLQSLVEKKRSRTTELRKMSSLRSFYHFLQRRKLVKLDPTEAITVKQGERRLPQIFYASEIKAVFKDLQKNKTVLNERNLALFSLFYATGMRVSEVSQLKIKQIDFDLRTILVHGKGKKDRYVAFDKQTGQALKTYLAQARLRLLAGHQDEHYVFLNRQGKRLSERGIEYVMQKVFNKAGIPGKVHPHELRHTFATAMLNNGADLRSVQELLGHSNLSTTQIYTHVTMSHLQNEYEKFFPRNKEKDNKIK